MSSSILDASHLEAEEQRYLETGEAPELQTITFADVIEAMRRSAYHQRKIVEEEAEAEELIKPLQAEIDRIRAWQAERRERRQKSIAIHQSKGMAYYRLNPPVKGKTIKGPGWRITAVDRGPKLRWDDEEAFASSLEAHAPDLIKHKPVIDKNGVKQAAKDGRIRFEDGRVYIITEDGEKVELSGVAVEEQPTEYQVKLEEE